MKPSLHIVALVILLLTAHKAIAAVSDLSFTVALSEAVTVDTGGGTPTLSLDIGGLTRQASYTGGTGTTALTFAYTPQAGDVDLDGITLISPLVLHGATIKDARGNDATLTFSLPDTSGVKLNYPSLSLDFSADADGRYTLNGTSYDTLPAFLTASGGSFSRASIATYFDSSGVLQTVASDTPRFDYDMNTLSFKGLLLEEGRTNFLPNAEMTGVTIGVLGSGGVLPTNWNSSTSCGAGIIREVVAAGTLANGMKYFDFRVSGTNSGGSQCYPDLYFIPGTSAAAAVTQVWTSSVYAARIAGSDANFATSRYICVSEVDSAATYLGATCSGIIDGTFARRSSTKTFSSASAAYARTYISLAVPSGNSVDITLRVAAPQLERGAFVTSYIPTTTTAVTRATDNLSIPVGSWFSATAGTLSSTYSSAAPLGTSTRVASLSNGGSNNVFQLANTTTGIVISQKAVSGTIFNSTGPAYVANTLFKAAASFDTTGNPLAVAGTLYSNSNAGVPSGITKMDIGTQNLANVLNGWIRKIFYYPMRVPNAQLQLLSQ